MSHRYSQYSLQNSSFPARQGLVEIDPNRLLTHQPAVMGKPAGKPVVPAVPNPWPTFAPCPLPTRTTGSLPVPSGSVSTASSTLPQAIPSNKRKSDALDNVGPDAAAADLTDCDVLRHRIRDFILSGHIRGGEFQRAIGVSPAAYATFMKQRGPTAGQRCSTYKNALDYFIKQHPNSQSNVGPSKPPAKKAKKSDIAQNLDVSGVNLPGEEHGRVPVFDTCDELRKKIRAMLKKDGVTQASFCRELTKMVADRGRKVNPSSFAKFMGQKGTSDGSGSIVFYAGYVLFEKLRVRDGKPKSQFRLEMENAWGEEGMDIPEEGERGSRGYYTCHANEYPYEDKYGKVHFIGR